MPHDYPLHVDLDVECYCCGALQQFRFSSPTDHVVCSFCTHHLGGTKAERRDRDHLRLWSERYGELRQRLDSLEWTTTRHSELAEVTAAELRGTVHELRRTIAGQFDAGTVDGIRSLIENDVIRRAERHAQLTERRNDRLMIVLWRIDAIHHDADAAALHCSCGRKTAECAEWKAVQGERTALHDWERRQLALEVSGTRNGLPPEHPSKTRPTAVVRAAGTSPSERRADERRANERRADERRSNERRADDRRGAGSSEHRKPR